MVATNPYASTCSTPWPTSPWRACPPPVADYLALAEDFPHKIEYHLSQIIVIGLSTPEHEAIVANLIWLLQNLFSNDGDVRVFGSNAGAHLPQFEGGYYLPDLTLVRGPLQLNRDGNRQVITNPALVVEVLSPSTAAYDLAEKLGEYKKLETLQQILFVHRDQLWAMSFARTDQPNTWLNQDFRQPDELVPLAGAHAPLRDIYKKIKFDKP
jgi:Uma2 family endonuclease